MIVKKNSAMGRNISLTRYDKKRKMFFFNFMIGLELRIKSF